MPDCTLHDERTLRGVLRHAAGRNPRGRTVPAPRANFALARGGQTVAILDAKYRDLWDRGLPLAMLYQLVLYALAHGDLPHATLLYPSADPSAREEEIEVADPDRGAPLARVRLRPIDLARLADLIADNSAAARLARREYAASLAFSKNPRA